MGQSRGDRHERAVRLLARVEAKPDKAEDVAALASALTRAEAESGTVDWYAARTSPTAFWIFDTLGTEQDRQARSNGEIAAAVIVKADAVPIIAELRPSLVAHLMATGRRGKPDALVFGRTDAEPFLRSTPRSRARKAWVAAGLDPITMHECRHTYASTMVAAGIDPGEAMRRMGHSTVAMTLDRYTHGITGNEADTAAKLEAFIDLAHGTVVGQSGTAPSFPQGS